MSELDVPHLGLRWVLAGCVLAGCADRPSPLAPAVRTAEIRTRAAAALAARVPPIELPPIREDEWALWLEPTVDEPIEPRFGDIEAVFRGPTVVVVKVSDAYAALSERFGVSGPLAIPAASSRPAPWPLSTWVGVDGAGQVFAANAAGKLFRAPDLIAAERLEGFAAASSVPGAVAWDTNGAFVVAATESSVFASENGGVTFRRVGSVSPANLARVFVRADGAIVAQARAADPAGPHPTWVGDARRGLRRSPLEPTELSRTGQGIFALAPCYPVLSSDGVHWASETEFHRGLDPWQRAFSPSERLVAFVRDLPEAHARPPPAPPAPGTEPSWERCTGSHRTRAPRISMGSSVGASTRCACAAYIAGSVDDEPEPSAVEVQLWSDGRCHEKDQALEAEGYSPRFESCDPDAPLVRPPSAAILHRDTGSFAAARLPADCRPDAMLSRGGIGVLLCAPPPDESELRVYTVDRTGAFHAEGRLPVKRAGAARSLSLAWDGTLLLRVSWSPGLERRAFVRRPLPLGSPSAWREVDVSDALEVRVDTGGALLLLRANRGVPCPGAFDLEYDVPGEPRRVIAERIAVEGTLFGLRIERRRRILVQTSEELYSSYCNLRASELRSDAPWYAVTKKGLVAFRDEWEGYY